MSKSSNSSQSSTKNKFDPDIELASEKMDNFDLIKVSTRTERMILRQGAHSEEKFGEFLQKNRKVIQRIR